MCVTIHKLLYDSFPRQIAIPYRITTNTSEEFYEQINRYKSYKRVFATIYNYTSSEVYDNAFLNVDKIFFDLDGEKSFVEAVKLSNEFGRRNMRYLMLYSGAGFHFYLFTKNYAELKNKKAALFSAHSFFVRKFKLTTMDEKVMGDVARVATIPGTFNNRRGRYCIPLTTDDLERGLKFIQRKATHQPHPCDYTVYGNKYLNMEMFDVGGKYYNNRYSSIDAQDYRLEYDDAICMQISHDSLLKTLPPCISSLLINSMSKRVGFRGRYLLITYLRDSGFLYGEIKDILEKYLVSTRNGRTEAYHCIVEERQLDRLFDVYNQPIFPRCELVKQYGYCPHSGYCDFTREYGTKDRHLVKIYR